MAWPLRPYFCGFPKFRKITTLKAYDSIMIKNSDPCFERAGDWGNI